MSHVSNIYYYTYTGKKSISDTFTGQGVEKPEAITALHDTFFTLNDGYSISDIENPSIKIETVVDSTLLFDLCTQYGLSLQAPSSAPEPLEELLV